MTRTLPIASLSPLEPLPAQSRIRAIIILSWPYSSLTKQCALLLADPDFRLRNHRGQIRARFTGPSAEAIARSKIGIGDEVHLELDGASWTEAPKDLVATPGKGVGGELIYKNVLGLHFQGSDGHLDLRLEGNEATSRGEERSQDMGMSTPARSVTFLPQGVHTLPNIDDVTYYDSPAFMKRPKLSGHVDLDSTFDPFIDESHGPAFSPSKRQKISWQYLDRSPSPDTEKIKNIAEPTAQSSMTLTGLAEVAQITHLSDVASAGLVPSHPAHGVESHDPSVIDVVPPYMERTVEAPLGHDIRDASLSREALRRHSDVLDSGNQYSIDSGEHALISPNADPATTSTTSIPLSFPSSEADIASANASRANASDFGSDQQRRSETDDQILQSPTASGAQSMSVISNAVETQDKVTILSQSAKRGMLESGHGTAARSYLGTSEISPASDGSHVHDAQLEHSHSLALPDDESESSHSRVRGSISHLNTLRNDIDPSLNTSLPVESGQDTIAQSSEGQNLYVDGKLSDHDERSLLRGGPSIYDTSQNHQSTQHSGIGPASGITDSLGEAATQSSHLFGYDGALEDVSPDLFQAEPVDQVRGMAKTFRALFGFRGSASPEHHAGQPVIEHDDDGVTQSSFANGMGRSDDTQDLPGAIDDRSERLASERSLEDEVNAPRPTTLDVADIVHVGISATGDSAPASRVRVNDPETATSSGPLARNERNMSLTEHELPTPSNDSIGLTRNQLEEEGGSIIEMVSPPPRDRETTEPNTSEALPSATSPGNNTEFSPTKLNTQQLASPSHDDDGRTTSQQDGSFSSGCSNRSVAEEDVEEILPTDSLKEDVNCDDTSFASNVSSQQPAVMESSHGMLPEVSMDTSYNPSTRVLQMPLLAVGITSHSHNEIDRQDSQPTQAHPSTQEAADAGQSPSIAPLIGNVQSESTAVESPNTRAPDEIDVPEPADSSMPDFSQNSSLDDWNVGSDITVQNPGISAHSPPMTLSGSDYTTSVAHGAASEAERPITHTDMGNFRSNVEELTVNETSVGSPLVEHSHQNLRDDDEDYTTQISTPRATENLKGSTAETSAKAFPHGRLEIPHNTASSPNGYGDVTSRKNEKSRSRKTASSRLSQVPEIISSWFSPRRSARLRIEERTKTDVDDTADHAATKPEPHLPVPRGIATSYGYFTPLATIEERLNPPSQSYSKSTVDVLAVVAEDSAAPARSKKGPKDYFTIINVKDPSQDAEGDTVRVEIYRPWHAQLPLANSGDVVLLREFAVKSRGNMPYLLSTDASAWCVWRYGMLSRTLSEDGEATTKAAQQARANLINGSREEVKGPPVELGEEERSRAGQLDEWWQSLGDGKG